MEMFPSGSFTWKRFGNAAGVWGAYQISRLTGKVVPPGYPLSISIEPTTSCNLRCPECPSGLRAFTRSTGSMDPVLFREILRQVSPYTMYMTLYFQGEPYLNPGFTDMVKLASGKKIFTVTSTNAHYLDEERSVQTVRSGLSRIIISLDGLTQESYSKYRIGGDVEKVYDGLRTLASAKKALRSKTPQIVVQFLVMEHNKHERGEVQRKVMALGADKVIFKTVQVYDYENGNPLLPSDSELSRYRKNQGGKYQPDNSYYNNCWKMWHSCVITWDGKVVPCCFDKDASHQMGDLRKDTLKAIWSSENYNRFRRTLFRNRKEIDICRNCSEGSRVYISPS